MIINKYVLSDNRYMTNPLVNLLKKTWKFSKHSRVITFIILSIFAQGIMLMQPLVMGQILNVIQEFGLTEDSLMTLGLYLLAILGITIGFWIFHGRSRDGSETSRGPLAGYLESLESPGHLRMPSSGFPVGSCGSNRPGVGGGEPDPLRLRAGAPLHTGW